MARTFELGHGHPDIELPRVTAFLDGYRALCERHGLSFEVEVGTYRDDPYSDVCVTPFREGAVSVFEAAEMSADIPEVADARKRRHDLEADRSAQRFVTQRHKEIAEEAARKADPKRAVLVQVVGEALASLLSASGPALPASVIAVSVADRIIANIPAFAAEPPEAV